MLLLVYAKLQLVLYPVLSPGIEALFKANCETGTTTSIDSNGGLSFRYGELVSFDPGRKPTLAELAIGDATVTFNSVANPFPTGKVEGANIPLLPLTFTEAKKGKRGLHYCLCLLLFLFRSLL